MPSAIMLSHSFYKKIKSSSYSRHCLKRVASPLPQLIRLWVTQLRSNVAVVASRWRHCDEFERAKNRTQPFRGDNDGSIASTGWFTILVNTYFSRTKSFSLSDALWLALRVDKLSFKDCIMLSVLHKRATSLAYLSRFRSFLSLEPSLFKEFCKKN